MKTKRELITQRDPKSPVSEVFRTCPQRAAGGART